MEERPPRRRGPRRPHGPPPEEWTGAEEAAPEVSPAKAAGVTLLLLLVLMAAQGVGRKEAGPPADLPGHHPAPAVKPTSARSPSGALPPEADAGQVRELLPSGSRLLDAFALPGGSVAVAWERDGSARAGVALPGSNGRYRLWVATTPRGADTAGAVAIDTVRLPGLPEEALVVAYRTEGCCAWVHLFALSDPPQVLFASPTFSSRLAARQIVVEHPPRGDYPEGTPGATEVWTWNGRAFMRSAVTLPPQHFFPLARGMRWQYRTADGAIVERWVQEWEEEAGGSLRCRVRSVARKDGQVTALPDALYRYAPDGGVKQMAPVTQRLLGPSPGVGSRWQAAEEAQAVVVAIRPQVTVPAGTFRDVLVVSQGDRRRYYAPHVGLIREDQGGAPVLLLRSYHSK